MNHENFLLNANPLVAYFQKSPRVFTKADIMRYIAEHGIRYLAQLPYTGEPVPVRLSVEKVSAASVRIGYSILSPVDGRECVRAFTVLAFWDSVAGRLTRLSPEQRELLSSYLPQK